MSLARRDVNLWKRSHQCLKIHGSFFFVRGDEPFWSATFEDLQALFTSYQKRDVCSPEDGPFGGICRDSAPKFLEDGWLGAAVAISFCLLYIYLYIYSII